MPGVLRARRRQRSRLADVPGDAHRRRMDRQRSEGVDELRPVRPALRPAHPYGRAPEQRAPWHHRASSSTSNPPGITIRPIETQHGRLEFAEVFFDDVFVPADRMLGDVGQGWQVAMDILPYERSTTFWHRGAHLHQRCNQLVAQVAASGDVPATSGEGSRRGVPGGVRVPDAIAGDATPSRRR